MLSPFYNPNNNHMPAIRRPWPLKVVLSTLSAHFVLKAVASKIYK
jgi:hypothetical protein